jgi:hypothetical protein
MRTSGVALDVFDDTHGNTLREVFPSLESVPERVKTAHLLTSSERDSLPDELYALVMVNGDQKLRKYACVDEGNTLLSCVYFLKNAHKLPEEAQKVAAANLVEACGWYNMPVPEPLQKIALGLGTALSAAMAVPVITGTAKSIKTNMGAARQLGGNVATPKQLGQLGQQLGPKLGEATGTPAMPYQPSAVATKAKTVVTKTASRECLDVTGLEAPTSATEKKAARYALDGKYPLDSYVQVKAASAYFNEWGSHFVPEDRRQFCAELVKRANELGIPISTRVQKYGSPSYAPTEELKVAHDARRLQLVDNREATDLLDRLFQKRAEIDPDLFSAALATFDKTAGLVAYYDRSVPDAFYSTYGVVEAQADDDFSEIIGNDRVTGTDLTLLARGRQEDLRELFDEEFCHEFREDPVGIFKSMPRDQKRVLARMATDTV